MLSDNRVEINKADIDNRSFFFMGFLFVGSDGDNITIDGLSVKRDLVSWFSSPVVFSS
jgi:hypothetical protein